MARTPKSGPKKPETTIDIDPKDVKRIDGTTPAPEDGVSDITSTQSMKPQAETNDVKPAEADAEKATGAVAGPADDKTAGDGKVTAAPKPEPKSEPAKPAAAKPDDKVKTASGTPSAFATKPTGGASSSPPSASQEQRRAGSAVMGGVIGGLIVLALGAGLQAAGIWPATRAVDDGRDIALRTEIDTLRADINQLRSAAGDGAAMQERLAALEVAIAEAGDAPDVEAALADVEQRLTSAGDASADNAARLDGIEQSLADLEARLASVEETNPSERIIAASALKSAIDRGQPFTTELDAYAALGGEASGVEVLRSHAENGVPTRAEINAEVEDATRAMIAAASAADPNAGFIDRLSASARSLVQVRPVGMAEGDGVAAIAARLEASVRQDDYERAIADYESLPEDAQAAGSDFMDKVRARHAADQLIDDALATALQDS